MLCMFSNNEVLQRMQYSLSTVYLLLLIKRSLTLYAHWILIGCELF